MDEFEGFDTAPGTLVAATLAGQAVQMCLSAARLHLGDPDERGRRLATPTPDDAWLAILAADALIDALLPLVDSDTATALGQSLGQLLAAFPARYPAYQARLPLTLTARMAQHGQAVTPNAPAPAPAPAPNRAPCEPVKVDELVHQLFQAFVSVAGHHLGDPLPAGGRLPAPDPEEARLCLTLAGALYAQLFDMLSPGVAERWRAELAAMLERFEDAAAPMGAPAASLEAVAAAAWADVEGP
ncbi:MAG: hypothetical protein ACK46X_03080 [Candidatus Sericytochromatia bacterium]